MLKNKIKLKITTKAQKYKKIISFLYQMSQTIYRILKKIKKILPEIIKF